jgi:hypothetical protein
MDGGASAGGMRKVHLVGFATNLTDSSPRYPFPSQSNFHAQPLQASQESIHWTEYFKTDEPYLSALKPR